MNVIFWHCLSTRISVRYANLFIILNPLIFFESNLNTLNNHSDDQSGQYFDRRNEKPRTCADKVVATSPRQNRRVDHPSSASHGVLTHPDLFVFDFARCLYFPRWQMHPCKSVAGPSANWYALANNRTLRFNETFYFITSCLGLLKHRSGEIWTFYNVLMV